jgi:Mg-chelatase subunit ChlI
MTILFIFSSILILIVYMRSIGLNLNNMLMVGPPRAGKSLLARALLEILPDMTLEEPLDVTRKYSM